MSQLPIPDFFQPDRVGEVWRVPYQERAQQASAWAKLHHIPPAADDRTRICLVLIDVQNTFCLPEFELFVQGAVADNRRLCEFIYRNLPYITAITATMDTHTAMQIFHPIFWVNSQGEHPIPNATVITVEDVQAGKWQVNPAIADSLSQGKYEQLQSYALHYVKQLSADGKYPLTVWGYHSMLGGIGHALVSAVEEALFFHNICRYSQTDFQMKGSHPLTENYSVFRPEVLVDEHGRAIAHKNSALLQKLLTFDAVLIAGQAKSHCVAWTVADLLTEIKAIDPALAQKIYLLTDCTSPVVVPDVVDYTEQANQAFAEFAKAGVQLVATQDCIVQTDCYLHKFWPGHSAY